MIQPSIARYAYPPLDQTRRETRLVQYLGVVRYNGAFVPAFRCKTISLLAPPNYLAISYPCGDVDDLRPIFIDDKVTYIYENLDLALRDLRPRIEGQLLWCDAICINQHDDSEKSYQILQLQYIYMQADEVLVWPGPGSSQLKEASAAVTELSQASMLIDEHMTTLLTIVPDLPDSNSKDRKTDAIASLILKRACKNISDGMRESLVQFFAMSWWKRVWILQEFALAKQVAFVCGDAFLSLETLGHAVRSMQEISRLTSDGPASSLKLDSAQVSAFYFCRSRARVFAMRKARLEVVSNPEQTSLIRLLTFTTIDRRLGRDFFQSGENFFRSSDPRDRIFALLSIASDGERIRIKPDYSKSKNEVYIETARALMSGGKLNLLSMRNEYTPDRQLPSWVPDWTNPILESLSFDDTVPNDRLPFRATRNISARIRPSPPRILSLKALLVDNIAWVSGTPKALASEDPLPNGRECMIDFYQDVLEMHKSLTGIEAESDAQLAPFALAVIGGQVWDLRQHQYVRPDVCVAIRAFRIVAGWLGAENKGIDTNAALDYMLTGARRLQGRQFVFLSDRRVGLTTSRAVAGDFVYLIPGADIPFILRPDQSTDKSDHFEIIGEVYVHGIMNGEFLDTHPNMTTVHLV